MGTVVDDGTWVLWWMMARGYCGGCYVGTVVDDGTWALWWMMAHGYCGGWHEIRTRKLYKPVSAQLNRIFTTICRSAVVKSLLKSLPHHADSLHDTNNRNG